MAWAFLLARTVPTLFVVYTRAERNWIGGYYHFQSQI